LIICSQFVFIIFLLQIVPVDVVALFLTGIFQVDLFRRFVAASGIVKLPYVTATIFVLA